jgi:hypothetical protein
VVFYSAGQDGRIEGKSIWVILICEGVVGGGSLIFGYLALVLGMERAMGFLVIDLKLFNIS